jgi:hypothetical protein
MITRLFVDDVAGHSPVKNVEVEALGFHVAQSSQPMKGVLLMMYRETTTIICLTVLIIALEMKGSRFEKLILSPFLKSTAPGILPLVHIDLHIRVYVYTSTMKGNRNCITLYLHDNR